MSVQKSLDVLEGTVHRNMDIKDNSVAGLGKKEEIHRESLYNFREYIYHHEDI